MIRFDNWQIKQEGGIIARQYDNLTRRLDVLGDFPEGWTWELLVQVKGKLDVIALSPVEGGVGVLLKASMLALGGQYAVQLRGTRGDQVRHTNILYSVYIPESLSGSEAWPTVPSAVEQALQQLEELNQHPPYPGSNGYWMVWDLDTNTYIESQLPLPPVAEGPPGKAATIEVGTTTTGDPGTQAQVTNAGTENAAVLNFTIPAGAIGPTGATPDISVQVSSLPAGSEPTVSVSGTPEAPVISLGIPAGQKGDPGTPGTNGTDGQTPNITIGTVETLPAGSSVTAAITGQTPNLVLNLGIPQGAAGAGLPPTDTAAAGDVPTWSGESVVWAPQAGGSAEVLMDITLDADASIVKGLTITLDDLKVLIRKYTTIQMSYLLEPTTDSEQQNVGTINGGIYGDNWYQYYIKAFGSSGVSNTVPKYGGSALYGVSTINILGGINITDSSSHCRTSSNNVDEANLLGKMDFDNMPTSFSLRFSTNTVFGAGSRFLIVGS